MDEESSNDGTIDDEDTINEDLLPAADPDHTVRSPIYQSSNLERVPPTDQRRKYFPSLIVVCVLSR